MQVPKNLSQTVFLIFKVCSKNLAQQYCTKNGYEKILNYYYYFSGFKISMLVREFEQIPVKIKFFNLLLNCPKAFDQILSKKARIDSLISIFFLIHIYIHILILVSVDNSQN